MPGNVPNGGSSGCRPNEQPPWRQRGRPDGAVRAGGTSATDHPVAVIASLSNIIEVAHGNTGPWIVRRLQWIQRARQLNAQHPRQAQQNADTLNREFPNQEPTTAGEVTAILGLVTMAPPSEEEIPYDLSQILWDYSAPIAEDDARELHCRLLASHRDRVTWNVALSYLTLLHRMAIPEEDVSTDSEFGGE